MIFTHIAIAMSCILMKIECLWNDAQDKKLIISNEESVHIFFLNYNGTNAL